MVLNMASRAHKHTHTHTYTHKHYPPRRLANCKRCVVHDEYWPTSDLWLSFAHYIYKLATLPHNHHNHSNLELLTNVFIYIWLACVTFRRSARPTWFFIVALNQNKHWSPTPPLNGKLAPALYSLMPKVYTCPERAVCMCVPYVW